MNYPYLEKQTLIHFLLNTFDWRMWNRNEDCECAWQYFQGKLMFIILAGCPYHD